MATEVLSSTSDQTRSVFNDVLQQAYLQSTHNDKKAGKKKKRSDKEVLETLRKGEGITKDEDKILLANTYDPDNDVKNTKSNKNRSRAAKKKHSDVEDDKDKEVIVTAKPVNKKTNRAPKSKKETTVNNSAVNTNLNNADTRPLTATKTPTGRKAKKQPRGPRTVTSDSEQVLSEGTETGDDHDKTRDKPLPPDDKLLPPDDTHHPDDDSQVVMRKKAKKKKKKPREEEEVEEQVAAYAEALEGQIEEEAPVPPRVIEDDGRIVGLTIHRTDKLKTDFFIAHPLVRVSVVDVSTGQYIKKQQISRPVTSFYEKENVKVDMILPIMTQPYDFKVHKSTLPVWEEMLIFNENFNYLTQDDPNVVVFFEVLDFVSMNTANAQYRTAKKDGGWHRIGWAFLKVLGANGVPNTDKKVRLQLYQPPVRFRPRGEQLEIFQWWKSSVRTAYPSTLYVTLKSIVPPAQVEPAARSMFATQQEKGKISYDELSKTFDESTRREPSAARRGPWPWSRLPGQVCRVPNSAILSLPAGRKGCFVLRFSHDGKSLACACADKEGHPVIIYEIPSGKMKGQMLGHFSIIYDLCWSRNDQQLVSASADGTARVWDVVKLATSPQKTLPHPSFVYTAQFHPRASKVLVTGGYDRMIRVWSLGRDEGQVELLQELDGHISHVNTMCFDEEGGKLYSGDNLGQIHIWNVFATDKPSSKGLVKDCTPFRTISDTEIKGIAINCLTLHPSGRRLLVHCRDNSIRMLDLRVNSIMQRYIGALNFREHIRSTFSPCGTFVLAGSEDACAYVWNTETGDQVAMYSELSYRSPVSDVAFHPHDHMVAFCSYGDSQPVFVYQYDHKVAQRDVGMDFIEPLTSTRKSARPQSPEMQHTAKHYEDDRVESARSKFNSASVQFKTEDVTRLDRVMKKLESVSAFQTAPVDHPLGVPAGSPTLPHAPPGTMGYISTWGSTFDGSGLQSRSRAASPEPGAFSPHSSRVSSAALQQQQHHYTAQTDYLRQSGSQWRPEFMSVGRQGSGRTSDHYGRSPQLSMSMNQGKAQFSFQGVASKAFAAKDLVVALYDYQAQRSDEISLVRGDIVTVLHKDNANWWMGELPGGEQGFFPANYVAGYMTDTAKDMDNESDADYRINMEAEDENVSQSVTTALVTKSGELKFLSGAEDSDADTPLRSKKKGRRSGETVVDMPPDTLAKSVKKKRAGSKVRGVPPV